MKLISIVTPCFNEAENVEPLHREVKRVLDGLGPEYAWEHLFIDNASTDTTVEKLRKLAADDHRVKVIVNMRNFGVSRSPLHALYQARGDAIVPLAADFQDPPELIGEFVKKWAEGYPVVAAVKKKTEEGGLMAAARKWYYRMLSSISETELINDFTGFGLYDRRVIDLLRSTGDHYPYLRGLVCDMGFDIARVEYLRPERKRGFSKNRFFHLYAEAMNGITSHSKLPLRLAALVGFAASLLSLLVAFVYLVYKLLYWSEFTVGIAPVVIGLFFFSSVQLMFLGVVGEYIGKMYTRMFQRWLVVERERLNLDERPVVRPPETPQAGEVRA